MADLSIDTAEPAVGQEEHAGLQGSLLRRLHRAYGELPAKERQVADVILDLPHEMAVWSATELAARAGVSNATISRVVRRLGYANFEAARQDARKLRETGSPLFMPSARKAREAPIDAALRAELRIIQDTFARQDRSSLREMAVAMAAAPRVRTLGFRNSAHLVGYFTNQIAQIRPDVAPLVTGAQTLAEAVVSLGPEDVVLVVGLRRRPLGFRETLRAISSRGARIVLIADRSLRDAPALVSWVLPCATRTDWSLDSVAGAVALLRLVVIECTEVLGEAGTRYMSDIEHLREVLKEMEPPAD